jgi:hypothetical protein
MLDGRPPDGCLRRDAVSMLAGIGKFVGSKVLTAVLIVAGAMVLIWYWQLPPESKQAIWTAIQHALLWIGLVAALPWGLFFLPAIAVRAESNLASAGLLLGYLVFDVVAAFWLAGWQVGSTAAWVVLILGFLAAAVYNFLVCELLAGRSDESP